MTIKELNQTLGIMHTIYPYEDENTQIAIERDPVGYRVVQIATFDKSGVEVSLRKNVTGEGRTKECRE